jgi:hypothetical protein
VDLAFAAAKEAVGEASHRSPDVVQPVPDPAKITAELMDGDQVIDDERDTADLTEASNRLDPFCVHARRIPAALPPLVSHTDLTRTRPTRNSASRIRCRTSDSASAPPAHHSPSPVPVSQPPGGAARLPPRARRGYPTRVAHRSLLPAGRLVVGEDLERLHAPEPSSWTAKGCGLVGIDLGRAAHPALPSARRLLAALLLRRLIAASRLAARDESAEDDDRGIWTN